MTTVRFHRIVSLGGGQRTGDAGDLAVLSLADFRAGLVHKVTDKKHSVGSWCPVEFAWAPGARTQRSKAFVTGASNSVWLDIDKLPVSEWDAVLAYVAAQGWEAEAWTTFSYVPGGERLSCRMRVTVDRAHTSGDEVAAAREGLSRELTAVARPGAEHGPKAGLIADTQCLQPVTVFYLPAVHPDRADTGKVWTFDGPRRPSVSDLISRAEEDGLALAKQRLLISGKITARDEDEPATEADKVAAAERFARDVAFICTKEERPGRKSMLFRLGGRVNNTSAVGGLDYETSVATVLAALETNRPLEVDILWTQFDSGLRTSTKPAYRAEDALIEAEAKEDSAENRTWSGVEHDLASTSMEIGTLEAARAATVAHLAAAMHFVPAAKRKLTVIQAPAGIGKTTALAALATEAVRARVPTAILVPEHEVASEITRLLPEDVRGDVVHLHNPLVQVEGSTSCELSEAERALALRRVFHFGAKMYDICEGCRFRDTCQAKKDWESRNRRAKTATLVIATYKNTQAVEGDENLPRSIIVDEEPGLYDTAELTPDDLTAARTLPVDSLLAWVYAAETGTTPPEGLPTYTPTVADHVSEAVERAERAAAKVVAYYKVLDAEGSSVIRRDEGTRVAGAPSAMLAMLRTRSATVLTATPTSALLGIPGVEHKVISVTKHDGHTRVVFPRQRSGRSSLTLGVVEEAAHRVLREARGGKALLVTFKALADKLPAMPNLYVAHYGAVRGKNRWKDITAVICVGTPWDRHLETATFAGHEPGSEGAWGSARDAAAAELRQAVERARSVGKPGVGLWMGVLGAVAPMGWSSADTTLAVWESADALEGAELVTAVLAKMSRRELADRLGVDRSSVRLWSTGERPVPAKYLTSLRSL